MNISRLLYLSVLILVLFVFVTFGQNQSRQSGGDAISSSLLSGLKFRSIGPAFTSGRIAAISVDPNDFSHYYLAVASGGVWKTTNSGTTFAPVFDSEGSYSIGAVAIDPRNPNIVWVGTGENNSQRSVGYGDGLYKTTDGGKSWKNVGLKKSEHIARILIDPRNSNVVYVASQGPLWGPGGDRGLFKSTDGGTTWKNILSISENTGVTDLVMDPKDPDVLYAASYQRRRHVWTLINGGPESAIYKSEDGGNTWTKLTSGLPTVDIGRIGLAIPPTAPNIIYATIEASQKKGGIFRSTNFGATWERMNEYDETAMYYGKIFSDPKDPERIYVMNVRIQVSDDGGKTLRPLPDRWKHVDNHAMWINPIDTRHYLVGCDGGLYESFDRGATWNFKPNLPITQFYRVAVDNSSPYYYIYGGTQDNFSFGGPSHTRSASGITNSDWFVTNGGDGFQSAVDPIEPHIVYSQSQYGGLVRFDRRTGERVGIQPQPGKNEAAFRWNWDSPLIISPHKHTTIYFASNILFKSDDRGNTWRAISGDLSRQIDRNRLPVMGRVWGPDAVAKSASTSFYGNSTYMSESPLKEGYLFVGTDDGLINVTEDGGLTWKRLEKFPGVPELTYVSKILPSQHDVNTMYASFNNHKNADFRPYILKSTDAGKTWTTIISNLPENVPVWSIAEDHINKNLLFVGTEFGIFISLNGGGSWTQMKSGIPTIAVRDIAIQKRENDLVLATFGRGFYILDDYSSLRMMTTDILAKESHIFPIKEASMYIEAQPLGGRGKGMQGESFYTADNPPFGATITYHLKNTLKSQRDRRQEEEKEAIKKGTPPPYPTIDQLRAEEEEESSSIILTITDSDGNIVRRLSGPARSGIHRITWDLRYPASTLGQQRQESEDGERTGPSGPLVMPGDYSVSISKTVNGIVTPLGQTQRFSIVVDGISSMDPTDRKTLVEFQQNVSRLQGAVSGTVQTANEVKNRITQMKRALHETPAETNNLRSSLANVETKVNEILMALRGDMTARQRNENSAPSISQRVNGILGDTRMSTSLPTQTHRNAYDIASGELTTVLSSLRSIIDTDLKKIEQEMEKTGAPWTPGRFPEWKEK